MKLLTEATDLKGKYVLVRSSCNVPLKNGVVSNTYRLKQALPTLKFLRQAGARTIILSHIGREMSASLLPVYDAFTKLISMDWGGNITSDEFITKRALLEDGGILLAENVRQDEREVQNDVGYATLIASFGDIYVDDAFANIHRNHTTMVALPKLLPAYAGINLVNELNHMSQVIIPKTPSLFILGGAKFETKMPLLQKYSKIYDSIFVGGALVNDIIAGLGYEVGKSLCSDVSLAGSPLLTNPKLILPTDVIVIDETKHKRTCEITEVKPDEIIIDIGPATISSLIPYIRQSQTILWNGPVGKYEAGGNGGTHELAKLIARSGANSVIGGGDTIAAVEELGLNDAFGFVSTGGGAMLTLLEEGTTPALEALGYNSL